MTAIEPSADEIERVADAIRECAGEPYRVRASAAILAMDRRAEVVGEPVATVKVSNDGYSMSLRTHIAGALPDGDHDLYASRPAPAVDRRAEVVGEPFGYWIEQRLADPAFLRPPAYIPQPGPNTRVTPLYASPPAPAVAEPVYKAVERILDENSAWIARPSDEVTQRVALAATIAAHTILASEAETAPVMADDLPWRRRDIERGLILFRTSSNAHGSTNVSILSERVDALPQAAKDELAGMMRNVANGLSPAPAMTVPEDEEGEDVDEGMMNRARRRALDAVANAQVAPAPAVAVPEGWKLVPVEDTECMWSGLARDIVMWSRFSSPTGAALYRHLADIGTQAPDWLSQYIRDVDHVPSKGSVAGAIYRAMLAAAPTPPAAEAPAPITDDYDRGRRDVLNAILALNPQAAATVAKWHEDWEPNPEGKLPFDVVVWVHAVAEQLGIEPKDLPE